MKAFWFKSSCSAALCAVFPQACLINRCQIITVVPMTPSVCNGRFGGLSGCFRIILPPFSVHCRRALSLSLSPPLPQWLIVFPSHLAPDSPVCLSLKAWNNILKQTHFPCMPSLLSQKGHHFFCVNCWTRQFTTVSPFVVPRGCSGQKGEKGVFYFIAANLN